MKCQLSVKNTGEGMYNVRGVRELNKKRSVLLFAVYSAFMVLMLFEPWNMNFDGAGYHLNLHPLETIRGYFYILRTPEVNASPSLHGYAVTNLVGNVVLFMPLGYFLPRIWRRMRKIWRCMPLCIGIIALIELLQLVSGTRSCDIDDLILNTLGCLAGYLAFAAAKE